MIPLGSYSMKVINMAKCPENFRGAVARYLRAAVPPGGFLTAVLQNDLRETFNRGDDTSIFFLKELMVFLYNDVPYKAWGSPTRVERWRGIANDPDMTECIEVIND